VGENFDVIEDFVEIHEPNRRCVAGLDF
jgi:hypothetical protein